MKYTSIPAMGKAIMAALLLLIFAAPAQARKIYITKGSDNGVYLNGNTFSYLPGDTLVLRASQNPMSYFSLENIHGTASARIVIINEGGQVHLSAMAAKHCTYMKFTGTGSSDFYGFYMTSPNQSTLAPAVCITGRSADIEVDHVDINYHGYGFWAKEEGSCDPSLQYPNWRMNNISIHDNRMQNLNQEGIYAGSTAPNGERAVWCNGASTNPLPIRLGNVKIYNNIISRTGRGGIQLASCDFGVNEIYNNTVTYAGAEYTPSQGNGIVLGGYTTARVYNNTVDYTFSTGIFSLGSGEVRIENNRVDHSGQLDGRVANGSASIMVDTRLTVPVTNTKFYVQNNQLGANTDFGIRVYDTYPTYALGNVICNNTKIGGGEATYYVQGATNWFNCTAPTNSAPTANAGPMQTITLPATLTLSGSGSDLDGTIVGYAWSQMIGPSNVSFGTPNSASTTVGNLVAGTYTFKLTVTDNGGATGSANVTITVNAAGTGGGGGSTTGSTTRIEAENFVSMQGIQVENTSDVGGGQNIGWQDNNDWMDYAVNIASAGTYPVNFRVATMFSGAQFQLRRTDGTVVATVNVPNTGGFQTWQTITANVNLSAGQQNLRIYTTNAAGGWNINWWEIAGGSTTTTTNTAPVVNAGTAQTITLPTSSTTLTGSATGTIQTYTWSQVSGPSNAVFSTIYSTSTTVSSLVAGTYVFRLSAKDQNGLTGTGDVTVTVNATGGGGTGTGGTATTQKIEAENYTAMHGVVKETTQDVGGGQNIGYQDNGDWMDYSVNIASAGTYTFNFRVATANTGAQFEVRNAGGQVLKTVTVPNTTWYQVWETTSTQIQLPAGQQTLRIFTSNFAGGWNLNWFEIVGGSTTTTTNAAPVVNAGAAQTITLPSTLTLSGSATDADGTIASYAWSQVTGPNNATFATPNAASTQVNNLVAGTYTFKLTATDNSGASASANVTITVNAAPVSSTPTNLRIEAENFTAMFGIRLEATQDAGGGQNVAWQDTGDWMDYAVNVAAAGTYTVSFRVATEKTGPQFQLRNAAGTALTTVTVPRTGSFQTWQTITAQVTLPAGQQTLRIHTTNAKGGWNINWWEIAGAGSSTTTAGGEAEVLTETAAISVFPNPVADRFALKVDNALTGTVQVQVIDATGGVQKTFSVKKNTAGALQTYLSIGTLPKGTYVLRVTMKDWTESVQLVKQ